MKSFRRSRNNRRRRNFGKGKYITDQPRNDGKCYECGKYGHIASECPEAKKNHSRGNQKNKALSSWSDEDNSKNEHEEIANLCFMAMEESSTKVCNNCNDLKNLLDRAVTNLNRILTDFRNLQNDKRNLEIKLEVSEVEKDLLYEEIHELKTTLKNAQNKSIFLKSTSKNYQGSSSKSSLDGNYVSCNQSYKLTDSKTNSFEIMILLNGFGNLKEIQNALNSKYPKKFGYLKEENDFVLQEHHRKTKGRWYLDSGCSNHMTGDKNLFKSVAEYRGGSIRFGDNSKGTVIEIGTITFNDACDITNVYLVTGLKYNLLSISQNRVA
ncbi:uncharacterized protein LOC125868582 [Solanum stenotomum]|uniref:uncharacterized protein LOC125868582 n=1 Tax=Solanum stenotomum TaxID=172797 RepID=UPI0020D0B6FC|nr:uncharacterized protein LOC125868582 [Solanum stenotomum]